VALVPTPDTGSCASLLGTKADRNLNIANNMTALIAVEVIALALLAGIAVRDHPRRPTIIGYAAAAVTLIITAIIFWADRGLFINHAHDVSATAMFACILLVVGVNALNFKEVRDASLRNRYTVIAVAMAVATAGLLIARSAGWGYWLIALEGTLISLFAIFWVIQTWELRRVGCGSASGKHSGQYGGADAVLPVDGGLHGALPEGRGHRDGDRVDDALRDHRGGLLDGVLRALVRHWDPARARLAGLTRLRWLSNDTCIS
jgi:FtsH-binding integral membrane protein